MGSSCGCAKGPQVYPDIQKEDDPKVRKAFLSKQSESNFQKNNSQFVSHPMAPEHLSHGGLVGSACPLFVERLFCTLMPDRTFDDMSLFNLVSGHSFLLLVFYVRDFEPQSSKEILMLNKAYSSFSEMSTRLVAVSTDSQYSHLAWVDAPPNAGGLGSCQVPLISDHERVLCQLFDVLNGPDIVPAVALIDKQGVIYAVTLTEGQPLTPAILLEWIRLSVSQRSQHGPAPTSPVLGNLGGHQGSPPLRPLATDIKLGTHRMTSLDLNSPSRQRIHTPDSTTRSHSMVSNSLSSRWGAHSDRATEERLPELLQQVSVHSQGLLLEAFQLVDKQNENMVSKDEAVAFYNTFKESTTLPSMRIRILTKLAEQMVNQFDARADADGKILFDDFAHFLLNPDNDNDMHLTAEEEGMFADIEQQITSTEATRKLKDADYLET